MMTNEKIENGASHNVDFGHPQLSQQELDNRVESRRARFLVAVKRAQMVHGEAESKSQELVAKQRRLVGMAVAAALVLIVLGSFWMATTRPGMVPLLVDVAEAGPFSGVNVVIISSFDRHCVGNVYAYEVVDGSGGEEVEKFCARSNSSGILIIPPDEGKTERHFILRHDGLEVGELTAGTDDSHVRGLQRIQVAVAGEQQVQEFAVSLNPGETHPFTPSLRIELGSNSQDGWSGTVTLDGRWPPEFNHGNVMAGIVSVEGEANPALILEIAIGQDTLDANNTKPESLALISQSMEYDRKYRISPNHLEYWKALCHRGWYDCGNPPEDFLEHEAHAIDQQDELTWVSFSPVQHQRYAIKAPLSTDWEAGTVILQYYNAEGEKIVYPFSSLLSHQSPENATALYDVLINVNGISEDFYIPWYPMANYATIGLSNTMARRYTDESPVLKEATSHDNYPFEYWVRQFDFTLSDMSIKGPFRVIRDPEPPEFEIEFDPPRVGYVSKLRLTGNLDWIKGRPEWDFDGDKNADAWGLEAEYLVTQPGAHKVSVLVPGGDSQLVFVPQQLHCLAEGISAFRQGGFGTISIVDSVSKVPETNSSVWVINPESLGNRMDSSLNVMPTVGPDLYFEMPEYLAGKRVSEIRLTTFASPRGGDYHDMLVTATVLPMSSKAFKKKQVTMIPEIVVHKDGESTLLDPRLLSCRSLDYHVLESFTNNKYFDHDNPMTIHWLAKELKMSHIEEANKRFGFAFENLPEEQELTRVFREYLNTPEFQYKRIDQEKQQVVFTFDMQDMLITEDMGMLASMKIEHQNRLYTAQYEVYSGPDYPSRVEIETTDGQVHTTYYDYSTYPGAKIGVE